MTRLYIPLDIQRFAASLTITASESGYDIGSNTSTVVVTCTIKRTSGSTNWTHPYERTLTITCGSQSATHATELPSNKKSVTYSSTFYNVPHNADGTGSVYCTGNIAKTSSFPALSADITISLTTIPRAPVYNSISHSNVYETSARVTASINTQGLSATQWGWDLSDNGGSSWTYYDGYGTDRTFTGLTPGKQYWYRGYCATAGGSANSGWGTFTCPVYPQATSLAPFTIGKTTSQIFYLTNPLNRSVNVVLHLNDGSTYNLLTNTTYQGGITAEFNTAAAIAAEYLSIPNDPSGSYHLSVYCSATGTTMTSGNSTYSIAYSEEERPSFSASDWSYTSDLTDLTHNNQVVIKDHSTVTFSIDNAAVPQKSAGGISKYTIGIGDNSHQYSSENPSIVNASTNVLKVIAYDTRNWYRETSKTLESGVNYLPYTPLVLDYQSTYTHRNNGIEAATYLNISGNMSLDKFGADGENNEITLLQYRVYDIELERWTSYADIPLTNITYSGTSFTLHNYLIHEDTQSGGFTVGKRYYVQLKLADGNGNIILTNVESNYLTVTDGKISRDVFQDINGNYHQGINGLADDNYTDTIYGDINITGNYYKDGQLFTSGDSVPINSIFDYDGSTVPDGYEELVDYSTNEINTHEEWIDGKDIYRKVINPTLTTLSTSSWTSLYNLDNVSTMISISGVLIKSDGHYPIPRYENGSWNMNFRYLPNGQGGGNIEVLGAGYNTQTVTLYIILEYTKN